MRIVLLSGGSGKRLWPLSNEVRSKIFLKLLPAADGGMESMIQRVCGQLGRAGLLGSTSIVCHHSQEEILRRHLGEEIRLISEPCKKGTFHAIALAASFLFSMENTAADEIVCVLPADLYVEDDFFGRLLELPGLLSRSGSPLALVGTVPRHPSSQYGYIVPQPGEAAGNGEWFTAEAFVEKPDAAAAQQLIERQALWNCGIFAFPLQFMLSKMRSMGLPENYTALLTHYEALAEISFDHEVTEKTPGTAALVYGGSWMDLGSWSTLSLQIPRPVTGAGHIAGDSPGTHLVNELPQPVHIIGLPDIIVAASADGILVSSKERSDQIKGQLPEEPQRIHYEEKLWGTYRVLDYEEETTQQDGQGTSHQVLTKKAELLPGHGFSAHLHRKREEIWVILSGRGEAALTDQLLPVGAGDVVRIPPGMGHALRAMTALTLLEIQIGAELDEEDIFPSLEQELPPGAQV